MNDVSIPKILHQTWKNEDLDRKANEPFRTYALASQRSWRTHHPDFQYMFWTDDSMESFVREHYNWFYPAWKGFDVHIKRVDTARYCWLHYYGGMYCDLDMICLKNVEPLLEETDIVSYRTRLSIKRGALFAGNAWMASVKGHPLWLDMLRYTRDSPIHRTESPWDVVNHTGPRALGYVIASHMRLYPDSKILILDPDKIGNENEPPYEYAYHGRTHTW